MALFEKGGLDKPQNLIVTVLNNNAVPYSKDEIAKNPALQEGAIKGRYIDIQVDQSLKLGKDLATQKKRIQEISQNLDEGKDTGVAIARRVAKTGKYGKTYYTNSVPKGALQTNPHLYTSNTQKIDASVSHDGKEHYTKSHRDYYTSSQIMKMAQATDRSKVFPIKDKDGKTIGSVFSINAPVFPRNKQTYKGKDGKTHTIPAKLVVNTNGEMKPTTNKSFGPDTLKMQAGVVGIAKKQYEADYKERTEEKAKTAQKEAVASSTFDFSNPDAFAKLTPEKPAKDASQPTEAPQTTEASAPDANKGSELSEIAGAPGSNQGQEEQQAFSADDIPF